MPASIRTLISADSHVMEPLDLWTRELPPAWRALGPRLETRDGWTLLLVEDTIVRRFRMPGNAARNPTPVPADTGSPAADAEVAAGGVSSGADAFLAAAGDPAARLAALDTDGVWGEVMYPNLAFFCCHRIASAPLQVATARVYNDWVETQFLGASERFAPVAILPILDVAAAVDELTRVAGRGFRSVLLPAHVDSRPYNDPAYEPLWARAEELAIPLGFHAGTGRSQTPAHGPGGAVVNYVVTVSGPMETVAYLCGAGVLARHPALRVVMVECGSGWLAWALHAMDDAYREHHIFVRPKLELLPSEYFRRQGAVTFQHDPVGVATLGFTGAQCLMWGSDYPHPEGTWPHSRAVLARQLADLPVATAARLVCGNAAALYGFRPPATDPAAR